MIRTSRSDICSSTTLIALSSLHAFNAFLFTRLVKRAVRSFGQYGGRVMMLWFGRVRVGVAGNHELVISLHILPILTFLH